MLAESCSLSFSKLYESTPIDSLSKQTTPKDTEKTGKK